MEKDERSQGELLRGTGPAAASRIAGADWYQGIIASPPDADREFILNGCTYGDVYRLAAGIRALKRTGDEDNRLICLCTEDKALMAAAIVASLAGGPRLVLPYAFSRQAVSEVIETLSPSYLMTDRTGDFPDGVEIITPRVLPLEPVNLDTFIDPDDSFLMLFTGGSTGRPQVWSKTPRNLLAEARHLGEKFAISPGDIFLSTVPPQHIYGLLFSVLIPFICSSRVLDGIYVFPREILRSAFDRKATVLVSVPAHYRALKVDDLQRHGLRMAFSSAGALDKEDAVYFHEKTGLDIIEIYGSTETGGVAVRRRLKDGESWRHMEPVDWKIREGRLHVRSAFISPSLPCDDEGFFVTADRADSEGDDRFILRGRVDDIVKVGGKRVDLIAVQNKLKQIPGVRDAVVVSLPTAKGRQNELAAIVASHLSALQLRRHIAAISEEYAVPKRIAVLEELPMTSTGKYDRREIDRILRLSEKKPQG